MSSTSSSPVSSLLTWQDPIKTGKVFGSIILGLVIFKKVNLFNVFFHVAYIALLATAAAEYSGKLVTGQGFITKYKPANKSFAKEFNANYLPQIANFNEKLETEFQKIVYAHDIETTLKAAGLSYVFFKVTSWFTFFTLLTTSVVLLFSLPALYSKNKKEIDAAVAQYSKIAKEKTSELASAAQKKAAPHIETLVKKSGPVGSFISSKIPTRTAGSTVGESKTTDFKVDATPSSATTSGASKFPDVPSSSVSKSDTIEDVITEAKATANSAGADIPSL